MRWFLILAACSAPAPPAVIESRGVDRPAGQPNDCPYIEDFEPWVRELFPACAPIAFGGGLGICIGSNCADQPCELEMRSPELTRTTKNVFDVRGRFIAKMIDLVPHMACDYEGDFLERCSTNGIEHRVTRDANGRITALVSKTRSRALRYDADGRLTSIGDIRFVYDHRGWLRERHGQPVVHDDAGRVLRIGTPGLATTYGYDGDRLSSVSTSPRSTTDFYYDWKNRLVRTEHREYRIEWHLRYECK